MQRAAATPDQEQDDELVLSSAMFMNCDGCMVWNPEYEVVNLDVLHQRPRANLSPPRMSLLKSARAEKTRNAP